MKTLKIGMFPLTNKMRVISGTKEHEIRTGEFRMKKGRYGYRFYETKKVLHVSGTAEEKCDSPFLFSATG